MQKDMNNLSHHIERYILDLFNDEQEENCISLRRKELAKLFDCVPSQINYVLRSRFGPERGYLIESRRGEYGYIKIFRVTCGSPDELSEHVTNLIGGEISLYEAHRLLEALQDRELITGRERLLIEIALRYIAPDEGQSARSRELSEMLKTMLGGLMTDDND